MTVKRSRFHAGIIKSEMCRFKMESASCEFQKIVKLGLCTMDRDVLTWMKKQHAEQDELHCNLALGCRDLVKRLMPEHSILKDCNANRNYTIDCHLFWLLACKLEMLSRTPAAETTGIL